MPGKTPETAKNLEAIIVGIIFDSQVRIRRASGVEYSPDQIRVLNEMDAKDLAALRQMLNQ